MTENEFGRRISFPDFNMQSIYKILATVADLQDEAMVDAIISVGKENGISDIFILDKEFVLSALRHEVERRDSESITLDRLEAELIISLANNSLVLSKTARELFYHRNTLDYYVHQIHKKTGRNPMNFFDMCVLLPSARKVIERDER